MPNREAAQTSKLRDTISTKKKKYNAYTICQICGLRTYRKNGRKRMFMARYPKDVEMARKWVKVTGKECLAYISMKKLCSKFVCGFHFRPSDLINGTRQTKLRYGTVPSMWLKWKPLPDYMLEKFPATTTPIDLPTNDPTIIELQDHDYCYKIKYNVETPPVQKSSTEVTDKNIVDHNPTNDLKDSTLNTSKTTEYETMKPDGEVMRPKDNILKERNKSKSNNKQLKNSVSQDPKMLKEKYKTRSSPKKYVFTIGSGLYPTVMSNLKQKAETTIEKGKKNCLLLLFDEIKIKEHLFYNYFLGKVVGYVDFGDAGGRRKEVADRALVFMLRQTFHTPGQPFTKQPIAHYFYKSLISPEILSNILKTIIKSVGEAGYKVIASVCDNRKSHVDALNLLKGTNADSGGLNYYFVEDQKVLIIYEVPHLFMSMRNNLMQYGTLVLDNKVLKWSHLNKAKEKNKSTYKFFKIESPVNEIVSSRTGIKLAIKDLSNTMAAILKLLSESMENETEEIEIFQAGEVVEMLDKLFDLTNGPTYMRDTKEHRQFVRKNSIHHDLWEEYKRILNNSYFLCDSYSLYDIRCIESLIITISSLQDIWSYADSQRFQYLNLRIFTLDTLHNLFGGSVDDQVLINNMNCCDIESTLSMFVPERLNKSLVTNYANDNEEFYYYLKRESIAYESDWCLKKLIARFNSLPIIYMSAYLASILLRKEICPKCCSVLRAQEFEIKSIHNYKLLKDLWKEQIHMVYPSHRLCLTVLNAIRIFERGVKPVLYLKNILTYSVTLMSHVCDMTWMCDQHQRTISKRLLQNLNYLLLRNSCILLNENFIEQNDTKQTTSNLAKVPNQNVS